VIGYRLAGTGYRQFRSRSFFPRNDAYMPRTSFPEYSANARQSRRNVRAPSKRLRRTGILYSLQPRLELIRQTIIQIRNRFDMKRTILDFSHEIRKSIPPHVICEDCDATLRHYAVQLHEGSRSLLHLDIPAVKSVRRYCQIERLVREWKRQRTRCNKLYNVSLRTLNILSCPNDCRR